jgi:hypothetical protein
MRVTVNQRRGVIGEVEKGVPIDVVKVATLTMVDIRWIRWKRQAGAGIATREESLGSFVESA